MIFLLLFFFFSRLTLLTYLRNLNWVQTEPKGVNVVQVGKMTTTINEEYRFAHLLASPHWSVSYIKVPWFLTQANVVTFILYHSLVVSLLFFRFNNSSKYQNSLSVNLDTSRVNDPQLLFFSHKVKSFPRISFNIININFFYEIVWFWPIA